MQLKEIICTHNGSTYSAQTDHIYTLQISTYSLQHHIECTLRNGTLRRKGNNKYNNTNKFREEIMNGNHQSSSFYKIKISASLHQCKKSLEHKAISTEYKNDNINTIKVLIISVLIIYIHMGQLQPQCLYYAFVFLFGSRNKL